MLIYLFFPAAVIAAGCLCEIPFRKRGISPTKGVEYGFLAAFGLAVFAISAMRYFTGSDYGSYAELFRSFYFLSEEELFGLAHEKGFLMPLYAISPAVSDLRTFFAVISAVCAVGVTMLIKRYSGSVTVAAAAFILGGAWFYSMNFLRQFIAGMLVMAALRYAESREFLRFVTVILAATAFHWSAIILIPVYFLLKIRWNTTVMLFGGLAVLGGLIASEFAVNMGIELLYTKYKEQYTPDLAGLPVYYALGFSALFVLAYLLRERLYKRSEMNVIFVNCLFLTAFFEILGIRFAMLSRFAVLFVLPSLLGAVPELFICVSDILSEKKGKRGRLIAAAVFAAFGVAYYGCLLVMDGNGVVPYRTYETVMSEVNGE